MKKIAALLVSLRCTLIIDNSKHLVVIRIVIMTKCISGNRVGWRRFYCKTGRTFRKFGIRKTLDSAKAGEATIEVTTNANYAVDASKHVHSMKFSHTAHTRDLLHVHTACVLLDENQHFQDEGMQRVPKPKAQSQGSQQQDLDLFENGGAGVWR